MSQPVTPRPPFLDTPVTGQGRFSRSWNQYNVDVSDALARLQDQVQQLAARQTYHYTASAAGAQPAVTSTAFVTTGLGIGFTTGNPLKATRYQLTISGMLSNNANNGRSYVAIFHGTGPPPAAGVTMASAGGIQDGQPAQMYAAQAGAIVPFALSGIATIGATNTQFWFDLGQRANPGGCIVSDLELIVVSMLDPLVLT